MCVLTGECFGLGLNGLYVFFYDFYVDAIILASVPCEWRRGAAAEGLISEWWTPQTEKVPVIFFTPTELLRSCFQTVLACEGGLPSFSTERPPPLGGGGGGEQAKK